MNAFKKCTLLVCLALIGTLFTAKAAADPRDKATRVTFNTPVEVPGAVLAPGTYLFTVAPDTNGNVVQIWNADRTKLYATALTIPDYRLNPPDKPVVLFDQSSSSGAPALKAWCYPDEQFGRVFVYPKNKATELAKRNNQAVPAMQNAPASDNPTDLKTVVVIAINPWRTGSR